MPWEFTYKERELHQDRSCIIHKLIFFFSPLRICESCRSLSFICKTALCVLKSRSFSEYSKDINSSVVIMESTSHEAPLFTAVSSSARQLFHLLRCIGFASKAEVRISKDGLRFTVEESQVMQGQINRHFVRRYLEMLILIQALPS